MGGDGHQAEVYAGSGGRSFPTTASGCSCPGSGPSSGSGSSGGREVVVAESQIRQPAPVVASKPAGVETLLISLLSGIWRRCNSLDRDHSGVIGMTSCVSLLGGQVIVRLVTLF